LMWRCEGLPEILDFVSALQSEKRHFEYPLEGGGLHVDRLFGLKADPEVSRNARLVFHETGPEAQVKSIYFAIGRTGAVLPVALLEKSDDPELEIPDGAPIPACNGNSILDIQKESTVRVVSENGAPPLLRLMEKDAARAGSGPDNCPSCQSELRGAIDEPFFYCENQKCPGRIRSRILHLIGPNGLNLESISVRTAELLFSDKRCHLSALLSLSEEEIEIVSPGTGQKFVKEISRWKKIPLWKALYLSDIEHLSERDARSLAAFIGKLEGLEKLFDVRRPLEHLCGITPESYDGISKWLERDGLAELRSLEKIGVEVLDDDQQYSAIFRGRRIVVAGEFTHLNIDQIIIDVERYGARVDFRVGRMTDILIAGHKVKTEIESAHYYGTTVINEALLLSILREVE